MTAAFKLIGHEQVTSLLVSLRKEDRLPQTSLFFGPSGVGKAVAGRAYAADVLCEKQEGETFGGCGVCRSCRLVLSDSHADLHWIDAFDSDWNIDSIRELLGQLQLVAFEGGKRVVVFDHAESLGTGSFNVLLKALEEPRPGVYFLLISSSLFKIPITVRSRCSVFNFGRLLEEQVKQVLQAQTTAPPPVQQRIAKIVDGTVGDAISLLEHEKFYSELENSLEAIYDGSKHVACDLAQALGKEKTLLRERLHLMRLHAVAHLKRRSCVPDERRVWATCVANLIDAEGLIFDRYISAEQVLVTVLTLLANKSDQRIYERY